MRPAIFPLFFALFFVLSWAPAARAAPPGLAFLYQGEAEPSGVDRAFLALGRRRGAPSLRETPGQLGEALDGAAAAGLGARLQAGVAAYQRLQFKEAIAALDALEREAVARGGGDLTQGELVDLYAHRAAARSALGDEPAAWDDLLQLVTLAPTRPLDPARFPPRLVEAARRAAEARKTTATLTLSVEPPDALLVLDGEVVGRGQVSLERPIGRHLVRAERAGFRPSGRPVELTSLEGPQSLALALEAAPAPRPAELARRAQLAGCPRAVAAFVSVSGGQAELTLWLVEAPDRVVARGHVPLDDRLTTGALAQAVDALLGEAAAAGVPTQPPRPLVKSPVLWGVVAGIVGAALAVGLGVGLSQRDDSTRVHVDLGAAR